MSRFCFFVYFLYIRKYKPILPSWSSYSGFSFYITITKTVYILLQLRGIQSLVNNAKLLNLLIYFQNVRSILAHGLELNIVFKDKHKFILIVISNLSINKYLVFFCTWEGKFSISDRTSLNVVFHKILIRYKNGINDSRDWTGGVRRYAEAYTRGLIPLQYTTKAVAMRPPPGP